MKLHQLEYFCAVCRYQSIARASEELFVSQPTISVAIRDLEEEFGIHLFIHGKNKITLTPEAEEFYQKAEKILEQSRDMVKTFSRYSKNENVVKVGIPPMASILFFPQLKKIFEAKSETTLQLYEYGSLRARDLVDSRDLDVALVNMDFYDISHYNSHLMSEESYVYCVSRSHRFAGEKSLNFEMLKDENMIFYNTDSVQNKTLAARFASMGLKPHVILYSSQLGTILNFVQGGDCGSFLFSSTPADPKIFVKIPLEPKITCRLGIIWKKGIALSAGTSEFVNFVKDYRKESI